MEKKENSLHSKWLIIKNLKFNLKKKLILKNNIYTIY